MVNVQAGAFSFVQLARNHQPGVTIGRNRAIRGYPKILLEGLDQEGGAFR